MPALLSWINWLDRAACTVSASSEVLTLPAVNLREPALRRRWRTAMGTTTASISADFGAMREVGILALAQPDDAGGVDADGAAIGALAATDTVGHWLGSTPGGTDLYASGAVPGGWQRGHGLHVHALPAPVTARGWVAAIVGTSIAGPNAVLDMGRAWAGPVWQPARGNVSYGWSWAMDDASTVTRNPRSGVETVDRGAQARVLSFGFEVLTEADAAAMRDLRRVAGVGGQVLAVLRPEGGAADAVLGRLIRAEPIANRFHGGFTAAFSIRQTL